MYGEQGLLSNNFSPYKSYYISEFKCCHPCKYHSVLMEDKMAAEALKCYELWVRQMDYRMWNPSTLLLPPPPQKKEKVKIPACVTISSVLVLGMLW